MEELTVRYEVPRHLGHSWVEGEQLLLLLDGLDKVALSARRECIEAINRYRQAHQQVPIVVCSRTTEYREQATQLCLHTAVVIQPLSNEQIEQYLQRAGEQVEAVRVALSNDTDIQELVRTPLMLNVLLLAYQESEIVAEGTREAKEQQVFAAYVQRMLTRRGAAMRYTPEQTIRWLAWLARQMKQQGQSVFYIEQMQPDWLAHARLHRSYERWAVRLPGILIGGLLSLAVYTFLGFRGLGTAGYIIYGLIGGLPGGLLSGSKTASPFTERKGGSWRSRWRRLIPLGPLRNGLLVGLGVGLSFVFGLEPGYPLDGLIYGSICGLSSVLLSVTVVPENADTRETETSVGSSRSRWRRLIQAGHLRNGFVIGGLVGLSVGLREGLSYGLREELIVGLISGLSVGLSGGLSVGLIGLLLSVLLRGRSRTIQLTEVIVWSWRSLWRSLLQAEHLRNALMLGGLVWLSVGLIGGLIGGLSAGLIGGLSFGLSFGLSYWLLFGLIHGLSGTTLDASRRVKPNEGIRRSARNSLLLGLISGCVSSLIFTMNSILNTGLSELLSNGLSVWLSMGLSNGLIFGLRAELSYALSDGLRYAVVAGLGVGLLMGLLNGGLACLRHGVLRWLLWRVGSIPWNYPRFLDYAAERILLRKVGGGLSLSASLVAGLFRCTGGVSRERCIASPVQEMQNDAGP